MDFEEPAGPPLGFQISPITGDPVIMDSGSGGPRDHSLMAAMVSPRHNRRRNNNPTDNSNKCAETTTAHFLRTCGLCQRRLAPGRDIYMYRGDTAFCSIECREQQMKHDDRKNKCLVVAHNASSMTKEEYHHHNHGNSTATSDASGNTETFAAA